MLDHDLRVMLCYVITRYVALVAVGVTTVQRTTQMAVRYLRKYSARSQRVKIQTCKENFSTPDRLPRSRPWPLHQRSLLRQQEIVFSLIYQVSVERILPLF